MSNQQQVELHIEMYNKLLTAIEMNDYELLPSAAVNVLGATGDWLASLSNHELAELLSQVSAEILHRNEK